MTTLGLTPHQRKLLIQILAHIKSESTFHIARNHPSSHERYDLL